MTLFPEFCLCRNPYRQQSLTRVIIAFTLSSYKLITSTRSDLNVKQGQWERWTNNI
jgi:hypothetical protein